MEIAVLGGTGTVGRRTAEGLESRGHRVRRVSRRGETHRGDLVTGHGLAAALQDVDVVVNASNEASSRRASSVLVAGSERLLRGSSAHHVCVSIVGLEDLAHHASYYQVKLQQEQRVLKSGVPFTIVRSTQFHEFLARPLLPLRRLHIKARSRAVLQPVAADEVATAIADIVEAGPRNETVTVAGPEELTISGLCCWPGLPVPLLISPRLGRALRAGAATEAAPDVTGKLTWSEWLTSAP